MINSYHSDNQITDSDLPNYSYEAKTAVTNLYVIKSSHINMDNIN